MNHDEILESLPPDVQEAMRPGWLADPDNRPGIKLSELPRDAQLLAPQADLRMRARLSTGAVVYVQRDD